MLLRKHSKNNLKNRILSTYLSKKKLKLNYMNFKLKIQ